jgi:hypothetical protein
MTMANDLALLETAGVNFIDGNGVWPCLRLRKTHEPASANQKGLTKYWDEAVSDTTMARKNPTRSARRNNIKHPGR